MEEQKQRVAVLIGARSAVAGALAARLAREGWTLALGSREPLPVEGSSLAASVDATDESSVNQFTAQVVERFGRIDAVAVCVGSLLLKAAHRTTTAEWDAVLATNLTAPFLVLRATLPHLLKQGGSVVFVSSAAARRGLANHEAIAAAKAGLIGLTRSAAATYAGKKVRVNCVAPGLTESAMTQHLFDHEASRNASLAMHPLGRLGKPDDIASAMAWFLDPQQDWVTGQVLGVDGGLGDLGGRPGR